MPASRSRATIGAKPVMLAGRVESALGGALLAPFGDDAGGMRAVAQRDRQHLVGRRHLQVERQAGRGLDARQIRVADMAAVLAQMRGDAVAADRGDDLRRAHRIGMIAAARVADGGDMIDVDAQPQAATGRRRHGHAAARLPGFTAGIAASAAGTSSGA